MNYRWTVAQIGAREHYALAAALERRGRLRTLYTDIWFRPAIPGLEWFPTAVNSLLARQRAAIPGSKVRSFTASALARRYAASGTSLYRGFIEIGEWFAKRVRHEMERAPLAPAHESFLGYNTGCLEILEVLSDRGVFTVVDQIDPARTEDALVREERQSWPDWEPNPPPIPEAYWERLAAEWSIADKVIVNSQWSREALRRQGVPAEKLAMIPLAFEPDPTASSVQTRPRPAGAALTVLWLGTVTLRKGIPYLLEAARLLRGENVRFVIAGPLRIAPRIAAAAPANVSFVGRVARSALSRIYREADVFVLPTISDGFAITQLEAMSHGLPVIATPNCGEVVNDGVNGFVVPPRNAEQLAAAIVRFVEDQELLRQMSTDAQRRSNDFSLLRVGAELEKLAATRSRLNS